jgi:DNA polymerase-1
LNVLIADCETDGFLEVYTRLWTIQLGSADGENVTVYADQPGYPPLEEGLARLRSADRVVFHNGIRFDLEAINRLYPGTLRLEQMYDTLIATRLLNPEERANKLEDWGERLGILKGKYTGDFQTFDEELVRYARQDIIVTRALYRMVEP